MTRLAHHTGALWLAALVHRLSGLALTVFLPVHFLVLALALDGEGRLDAFLRWSEQPAVKLAESALVLLLTVHLLGGLRVLVIENLPWRDDQKTLATAAVALSLVVAVVFLVRLPW